MVVFVNTIYMFWYPDIGDNVVYEESVLETYDSIFTIIYWGIFSIGIVFLLFISLYNSKIEKRCAVRENVQLDKVRSEGQTLKTCSEKVGSEKGTVKTR